MTLDNVETCLHLQLLDPVQCNAKSVSGEAARCTLVHEVNFDLRLLICSVSTAQDSPSIRHGEVQPEAESTLDAPLLTLRRCESTRGNCVDTCSTRTHHTLQCVVVYRCKRRGHVRRLLKGAAHDAPDVNPTDAPPASWVLWWSNWIAPRSV